MRPFQRLSRTIAATLLASLGACSSAPTHFYTLQHDAAPVANATPASSAPFQIEVLPVAVPPQVDQAEFLVRQSDQRVAVLDNERWAAPLAAELRGAFAADLVAALGTRDVYGLPRPQGVPVYRIVIDVRVFDSWPGRHARIQADWSVRGNTEAALVTCTSTASIDVGADYDALVQGHQRAIAQISGDIATTVRGIAGGGAAACPH
jgi:uncharacterized lipoprotein YmbA